MKKQQIKNRNLDKMKLNNFAKDITYDEKLDFLLQQQQNKQCKNYELFSTKIQEAWIENKEALKTFDKSRKSNKPEIKSPEATF